MPKESFNIVEAVYVGSLTPICPVLRLMGKKWVEEDKMAWITFGIGIVLAFLVYLMTPCYPK